VRRASARAPLPAFPVRPVQPHEGPRRPPLPPRAAGPFAQPQQSFPNRPARAPWPEPGADSAGARPPLANGSYGDHPPPPHGTAERHERPPIAAAHVPRPSAPGEKGLLIEAVPRRMRVGVSTTAEVRIARDKIDGLLAALNGRDPHSSADLTRALSVRLRAKKGIFWIEPATAETQWIESEPGRIVGDFITWRWTVVPRRRGRTTSRRGWANRAS